MNSLHLHLTLHAKWFDLIAKGEKKEEYRYRTEYWKKRLERRIYDEVHFKNGYRKDSPFMRVKYEGLKIGHREGFGFVYILILGDVLEIRNWPRR